jgi:hypothetical protein
MVVEDLPVEALMQVSSKYFGSPTPPQKNSYLLTARKSFFLAYWYIFPFHKNKRVVAYSAYLSVYFLFLVVFQE